METYNQTAFPPLPNARGGSQYEVKNSSDSYDIYVNNEYVGKKVMVTQTEDLTDIMDFLKTQGVEDVNGKLDGDHYQITANDPEQVKDIMKVYLENR